MAFGKLGDMGRGFGRLGALGGAGKVTPPALLNLNDRVVFFGDSFVANGLSVSGVEQAYMTTGFTTWSQAYSGSKLYCPPGGNLGVQGNNTTQMLARVSDVVALNPKAVIMNGGTNDLPANVPAATIIANLQAIYAALLAGGVEYIFDQTITPRFGVTAAYPIGNSALSGPQETNRGTVNSFKMGAANSHIKPTNLETVLNWSAGGLQSDALHPNTVGCNAMGAAIGPTMLTCIVSGNILDSAVNAYDANPTFSGTSGTKSGTASGTVASNYNLTNSSAGGAAAAGSKSTLGGLTSQVVTLSGTYTYASGFQTVLGADNFGALPAANDVFECIYEVDVPSVTNLSTIYMQIIAYRSPDDFVLAIGEGCYSGDTNASNYPAAGAGKLTFRTPPVSFASGTLAQTTDNFVIEAVAGVTAGAIAGAPNIGRHIARKIPVGA